MLSTFGSSKGILFATCIIPRMMTRFVLCHGKTLASRRCLPMVVAGLELLACSYIWGLRPTIVTACLVSRADCGLVFSIAGLRDWLARGAFWFAGAVARWKDQGQVPRGFKI